MRGTWNGLMCAAAATALCVVAATATAEPPNVVRAVPDDGQKNVDPATKEIRITFDQPMDHTGHSIVAGGPTAPNVVGKPAWADDKTFVIRVQLEPRHDYRLSINSDRFTNFRNKNGEPAVPFPITFSTGRGKAAPGAKPLRDALARQNKEAIKALRRAIDEDYSYRDLHHLDWDALFREAGPALEEAESPTDFAREAADLLAHTKDLHVWLKAGEETIGAYSRRVDPNVNVRLLPKVVPDLKRHGRSVLTGRFEDGIIYVAVGSWTKDEPEAMEAAFRAVADAVDAKARGMIVDVRPNSGGDELLAREFAGCFVTGKNVYSTNTIRSGGKDAGPYDRAVEPAPGRPHFRGKVAVLMGRANMSSCESFLLMMRQVPGCKLIGERSYGSSGNPRPHDLGNVVTVFLSSWKDMLPDGTPLEGKGIQPDVAVKSERNDFRQRDPVLDEALTQLREKD